MTNQERIVFEDMFNQFNEFVKTHDDATIISDCTKEAFINQASNKVIEDFGQEHHEEGFNAGQDNMQDSMNGYY